MGVVEAIERALIGVGDGGRRPWEMVNLQRGLASTYISPLPLSRSEICII